jgi:hypothetical protein
MACDHGLLEHVEFLLAYGAPVGQRTKRGTALHEVARSGHLEILERLLAHGAVVDKRCSSFTPLMLAVSNGHAAVARRLVEAGADTQALTNGGGTLLHLAASSGNADTVRFVLPFCNVEQVDNNGVTAAQLAANEQTAAFDDVLDALLAAGAKLNTLAVDGQDEPWSPFATLAASGRFVAIKRLIERGVISVHYDNHGVNLMYYAAQCGNVEMMRWLLEQHVEVDMASTAGTGQIGETPLFVAAETGHLAALIFLAGAGANMRHATQSGDTPLRVAARNGFADCVRFLLWRGVEPTRTDIEQCVEHSEIPTALVVLIAHGCAVDGALLALAKNELTFMVLWHAGAPLDGASSTPLGTVLARICGAMPPVECALGDSCRDDTEHHEQLFLHERRRDEEAEASAMLAAFVDKLVGHGLALVNDRAVQVLLGLQSLGLPALVSTVIIDCACPLATLLPMHLKWRLVTLIKHFKATRRNSLNE